MKKLFLSFAAVSCSLLLFADIKLPQIFSDNMILQRNQLIPVWGWASPGEKISVQFNNQLVKTKAGKDGKWKLQLNQETAGGPYQLILKGKNTIVLSNVLVGEVWVCSGQSNMEMTVKQSGKLYENDIRETNYPQIREIKLPHAISDTLLTDFKDGKWRSADSTTVGNFSSVAYFFARKIYRELNVPIGIINSSWGGSMVETWISRESFEKTETFKNIFKPKSFMQVKDSVPAEKLWANHYPSLLYNAMVNPIVPYGIKGVIWYQGESNAGRANEYKQSFPLLIKDWREHWKQGDFPFYFVQLASFSADKGNSEKGSTWAELREAQTSTLSLPHTGMAVTLDIGETNDIHPRNKMDVGLRLAAIALNNDYGKEGEYSGPVFDKMVVEGNKASVSFTHKGKGLMIKDNYGYLKGFEIAGADQKFYYARAYIENEKVIVQNDKVTAPVAVRYGWASDMPEANLYNVEGFPAVPFRTDTWKGITEGVKYVVD